jgi:hypothetical protein
LTIRQDVEAIIPPKRHLTCEFIALNGTERKFESRRSAVQRGVYTKTVIKPVEMGNGLSFKVGARGIQIRKAVALFYQESRVRKKIFKIGRVKVSSWKTFNKKAGKNKKIVFSGL